MSMEPEEMVKQWRAAREKLLREFESKPKTVETLSELLAQLLMTEELTMIGITTMLKVDRR